MIDARSARPSKSRWAWYCASQPRWWLREVDGVTGGKTARSDPSASTTSRTASRIGVAASGHSVPVSLARHIGAGVEHPRRAGDRGPVEAWENEKLAVLRLVDGLGRGLDPGVVGVVAAFRVAGYATQASCWGHLDRPQTRGPWVHLVPRDERYDQFRERVEELLTLVNTRRVARHRHPVTSVIYDPENLEPAIVRVHVAATRRTRDGAPPALRRADLVAARRRMIALAEHLLAGKR